MQLLHSDPFLVFSDETPALGIKYKYCNASPMHKYCTALVLNCKHTVPGGSPTLNILLQWKKTALLIR